MGKGGIKLLQRVLQLSCLKEIIFLCSKISFLHLCHSKNIGLISLFLQHKLLLLQRYDQIQNGVCQKIIAVVKGNSELTQEDGRRRRRQILCEKHDNDDVSKYLTAKLQLPFNRSFCKRPENIYDKGRSRQNPRSTLSRLSQKNTFLSSSFFCPIVYIYEC